MQDFDDKELLVLLKKGSLTAYEALFNKYYKTLCLEAIFILKEEAVAEDLVQELFIEFWDKKLYKRVDMSVKGYLFRAVKNRCYNVKKKEKVDQRRLEEYQNFKQKRTVPRWMEGEELALKMKVVMQQLPPQRSRAFTLVYMEDKKYREAAEEMGISINSVKTHLKLALRVLRDKLEDFR